MGYKDSYDKLFYTGEVIPSDGVYTYGMSKDMMNNMIMAHTNMAYGMVSEEVKKNNDHNIECGEGPVFSVFMVRGIPEPIILWTEPGRENTFIALKSEFLLQEYE